VKKAHLLAGIITLGLVGCGLRQPVVELGGYAFRYGGKEYRIESVTPSTLEGYNILTRRDRGELVFKAIDKDQNGVLDEIITGEVPFDEAGRIYEEGLQEGEKRHLIRRRSTVREYRTSDAAGDYVLTSFVLALGDIYNRLTITQRQAFRETVILTDCNADGSIDLIERGVGTVVTYQPKYDRLLEKARRENKLILTDGHYLVIP